MSNQKTTQLRQLLSTGVEPGDWLPIVDVSEVTAPTGETKKILATSLATYIISGGLVDVALPYQGWESANGLAIDETPLGATDNYRCFTSMSAVGSDYTLAVRGYVPSDFTIQGWNRVFFGVGQGTILADTPAYHSAYIGIANYDLVARVTDGAGAYVQVSYPGFFTNYTERTFTAVMTKDSSFLKLYVNGATSASVSASISSYATMNTHAVMGNGRNNPNNIKCTIYEAHVFTSVLTPTKVRNMFYRGVDTNDSSLKASYNGNTLNGGPSQWLDSVGSNHLLLPISGARATNPGKRFILSFPISGTNQYLGDGSQRDVIPAKYVITSCLVESAGKPLLSVGSTSAVAPVSASGTGSWNNNRVALVSASYGVNPIGLLALGAAHADRSIYVFFSASAAPCTFSFDGYIRN